MDVNITIIDKTQKSFYLKAIERFYNDFSFSQLHNVSYSEKTIECQGYDKKTKKMFSKVYNEKDLF